MKKSYLINLFIIFFLFTKVNFCQTQGDIAFIGFNADGDKDFSIVLLSTISSNSTVYFTDDETTGVGTPSTLSGSEGTITWKTGNNDIAAGTVVVFTDIDNELNPDFGVSIGSISRTGSFSISSSKDGIIAYVGSDIGTPSTYIAALQIGNDSSELGPFDGDGITLTNTSLAIGTSIIVVDNTASPDGGTYYGSRSSQSTYSDYYSLLSDNSSNWSTETTNGELSLPFSTEAFTINSTSWTGAINSTWNLSGNWDNGIPTSSSTVSIPDLSNAPIIGSNSNASVGNLTINSGEILTINNGHGLTVSGHLSVLGDLQINSGGSLIVLGSSSGTMTYNRYIGTTNWYLVSSPLVGQTIVDFYTNESPALGSGTGNSQNVAIATYDNSQALLVDRWNYYTEGQVDGEDGDDTADTFISGKGYSVKMQSTGDISFTGTMPIENIEIPISDSSGTGGNSYNLVGNPYPSFIAANAYANSTNNLLTENISDLAEATLWLWNESIGDYESFNQASSSLHIAPGQGFFVSASNSSQFQFTKTMQSHQVTDSFRSNDENYGPKIELDITDGSTIRKTQIFYVEGSTTGFDNGYDSSLFNGATNIFEIYTQLISDNEGQNLSIQSLPQQNYENMIIPIGVNSAAGSEISISASVMNLPTDLKVFLEDKYDQTFTELNNNSEYQTTLNTDLNGVGRYYLHTTNEALGQDTPNLNHISIYQSSAENLRITGAHNSNMTLTLYDILGKPVLTSSFIGNGLNEIRISNINNGVYIIRLKSDNGIVNKKIIIKE